MVSGDKVNSDLSTLTSYFSKYDSTVSSLDSSWKGASYDNLKSKANEFSSSFSSTIQKEMSAFASACELYEQYKSVKSDLENARSSYNHAVANGDKSSASTYNSRISELTTQLNNLKSQIQSYLTIASSEKLESTSLTSSTDTTDLTNTTTPIAGTDWTSDANFKYYNQSGGWKNYRYSRGGSNTMGNSGCGVTSMAMVMASFGYDVNPNVTADWSADHGYHTDGTSEKFFTSYAKAQGINSKVLGKSANNIKTALQNNELVILHVGPGDFTGGGHYIVARGYDSKTNKVLIADPNKKKNNKWWDLNRVVNQLKGSEASWSFSK